jgi:predicted transcriptional regulator
MTKLLEKGIEAVRALPDDRQDMAGELLLSIAKNDPQYRLTTEQLQDVKLSLQEADQGEFATDEEIAESWKKFGV